MTEREAVTSALAGPLVKARATSAGRAPCAPMPGQQEHRLREQPSRLGNRPRHGRPHDRADTREAALARERGSPLGDECGDVLPDASAVREHQLLDVACSWIRGAHEAEDARSVEPARLQERLDRVCAEIGVDRQTRRRGRALRRAARGRRRHTRAPSSRCRRACRRRSRAAPRRVRRRTRARAPRSRRHRASRRRRVCGFTATTYGATASTIPQQKRPYADAASARPSTASPRSSTGSSSRRGSSPTTSWLRLRSTAFGEPVGEGRRGDPRARVEILRHREQSSARGSRPRRVRPRGEARRAARRGAPAAACAETSRSAAARPRPRARSTPLPHACLGCRGEARFELQAAGAPWQQRARRHDASGRRRRTRARSPSSTAGTRRQSSSERSRSSSRSVPRHLLERRDPVAQARGVLEPLRRREASEPRRAAPAAPQPGLRPSRRARGPPRQPSAGS